jgi:hypothetical protein
MRNYIMITNEMEIMLKGVVCFKELFQHSLGERNEKSGELITLI